MYQSSPELLKGTISPPATHNRSVADGQNSFLELCYISEIVTRSFHDECVSALAMGTEKHFHSPLHIAASRRQLKIGEVGEHGALPWLQNTPSRC